MAHRESHTHARGGGRYLASPGPFAADDGSPDISIRQAADSDALVEALKDGRVLVAVVAVVEEIEEVDGHSADKSSEMSVVSMINADGRRGLLAFTGLDAVRAWHQSARPVPVAGIDAARAALEDDCQALVLDVAGPRTQVVTEADLVALADLDPVDYARDLAYRLLTQDLASDRVSVTRISERLQIRCEGIGARDLAALIPPRVLALVPAGVEIVD